MAQLVKNLPAEWEISVQSLGLENTLEKGKATHSSILIWRTPRTVYSSLENSKDCVFHCHKDLDTSE